MKKFLKSFSYAFEGIGYAIKAESNIRLELAACLAVILCGVFFDITKAEWIICTLCMGFVLVGELFNTALETLTDLASPQYHDLAKKAKDVSAGAVLVAAICSAIVGFIIFVPYFRTWLGI